MRTWTVWLVLAGMSAHPAAVAAQTTPWAEVGDAQLRRDVELLKAEGLLAGPFLSWPLGFAELERLAIPRAGLAPHVVHAIARVLSAARASREHGVRGELRTQVTNRTRLVRDFADGAREPLDMRAEGAFSSAHGFARAGGSVRVSQAGRDVAPDRSLAAVSWDDLHFYAGYVDHFWGPGQEGSLILSSAARPFPALGVRRMGTTPFKPRWLRWIGRFRGEVFVGLLAEKREFDDPLLVAMRLELEAFRHLEIGLGRTIQMCGRGRPCDAGTWGRALIGVGNLDNTGTNIEPGNQLASIDLRFTGKAGGLAFALYGQALAEDEGTVMVYRFSQLWGALGTFAISGRGAMATLGLELADTRTRDYLVAGAFRPNTTYQHHIYTDGYTYHGSALGLSLAGDTRLASLRAEFTDAASHRYWAIVRAVEINAYSSPGHAVSDNRERLMMLSLGADLPLSTCFLHLEVRAQSDSPNTPGKIRPSGELEVGYKLRF